MKKRLIHFSLGSDVSRVSFESLESRRLMSAALPTISVSAHVATASETAPATSGMGQFMVTRTGSTAKALTVDYSLWKGDTAKSGVDFQKLSGVLKIAAGRSYGYIDINPIVQKKADAQRSVKLMLDSGKYQVSKSSAQVLIESNVATQATVSVIAKAATASETDPAGSGMGQFMITRSGSTAEALTVNYSFSSSETAISGTDFQPLSGTLKIAAGKGYGYVEIVPIAKGTSDPARSVQLVLESGSGYTVGQGTAQVTIASNGLETSPPPLVTLPTVSIAATKTDASETDPAGTGVGTFTVTRAGSTESDLVVSYSIDRSSTAVAGTNYQPLSGTVTIPAGQSSAAITLTPIDDEVVDASTTVGLALAGNSSYAIDLSHNNAIITIANTDATTANPDLISIAATQPNASELDPTGSGEGVYTITRSGPDTDPLTVSYHVDGSSTAVAGASFQALSGSVTFAAGQDIVTIDLVPIDDGVADSGKGVVLDLSNHYTYIVNSAAASASIVIANADVNPDPQVVTSASQLPAGEPANWFSYPLPGYVNLATEPLYGAGGPSPDDVTQGFVGDCAFLATISDIARLDPSAITKAIHQNTDGTYDVIFSNNLPAPISNWPTYTGNTVDIHIDGWVGVENSVQQWSTLNYAQLGSGDATWVAVLEKAFAVYSSGIQIPSYSVANEGQWAADCFGLFGVSTVTEYDATIVGSRSDNGVSEIGLENETATDMANAIVAELAAGKAVEYGTGDHIPTGAINPLVADHEYSVISVTTDTAGGQMITLRNPWGDIDGNSAYSTVSIDEVWSQLSSIDAASV